MRCFLNTVSATLHDIVEEHALKQIFHSSALQGFLQGYLLTGRHGLFPSYEAFIGIVTTMVSNEQCIVRAAAC